MDSKVQKNTQRRARPEKSESNLEERVIFVNRCSKVVKGGRRFSFSALVIVGDRNGHAGYALGKAKEVSEAIRKGGELARRTMVTILRSERTLPHDVIGRYAGARVLLKPASPGTGVIAGGAARAFLELAGVRDVLAKSLGGSSPLNVTRATIDALSQLRTWDSVCRMRFGRAPSVRKSGAGEAVVPAGAAVAVAEDQVV
jgi:small subunit ribosomal protein S5